MRSSEQINELAAALVKAQAQMKAAKKTSDNPYFKSKYADLATVVENDRKALTDNGLCVVQGASMVAGTDGHPMAIVVTTRLLHSSGQWIEDTMGCTPKDMSPQIVGAATTYLRRYGYGGIVNSTAEGEDDDGNQASGKDKKAPEPETPSDPFAVERAWLNKVYLRLRKNAHLVPLTDGATVDSRMKRMSEEWAKAKDTIPSQRHLVKKWREQIEPYVKQANEKEYQEFVTEFNERVEKDGVEF